MKDILIIGAGPAGLTAAVYAVRYGYNATVFEVLQHGGQVATTFEVENYPAIEKITGYELATKLYEQAKNLGVNFVKEQAVKIEGIGTIKKVFTANGEYEGKAIIIATGAKRRKLNCQGEGELLGRGVSYCATCDGNFFRNKDVAIVGGGNTALEDTLFLSNICKSVYLIHRRASFRGLHTLVEAVLARKNINVLYNSQVSAINGSNIVESVEVKTAEGQRKLAVGGIFIAVGTEPDNEFLNGIITLNEQGYIVADESCKTNIEGVFVAGDSRTKALRQIVTATADGAIAAFMAANYLGTK